MVRNYCIPNQKTQTIDMDRNEMNKETHATKSTASTRRIWIWVIGAGIILSAIAHFGGWFYHDLDMTPTTTPQEEIVPSDTVRGDVIVNPDTSATDVRR
ncbi:hypothetical protein GCM10027291_03750 [Telluribacter humicola]